jgi:hypothetical protein
MKVIVCQTKQSRYLFDAKTVAVALNAEINGVVEPIST